MAVHHILEADIAGQPHYKDFSLPAETVYIIIILLDYDIRTIENVHRQFQILKLFGALWQGLQGLARC